MRFEFSTAQRIVFGEGSVESLPAASREKGSRPLLVTGRNPERAKKYLDIDDEFCFRIDGEPTLQQVRDGAARARTLGCDHIIGFGGGSAIDAGKAIAAMAANSGEPLDYLEVIGRGQPLAAPSLPFIAVPTTAGTGSEATRNAVLASPEHQMKASLRGPSLLPTLAIVDPALTLSLPANITASTGLDALTQLIEPYVSLKANPIADSFCQQGIPVAVQSLCQAYEGSAFARVNMSLASLLSGMALANAGLGAVHGFAAVIGGMFAAPHGAICAALLPHATAVNIDALRRRDPASKSLQRYAYLECLMPGGFRWLEEIVDSLEIPLLAEYGIEVSHVPAIVSQASKASSMKTNPIVLTNQELTHIMERSL